MERTLDSLAFDNTTDADVGAQVWTIGVETVDTTRLTTKDDQILTKAEDGFDRVLPKVFGSAHRLPSVGKPRWTLLETVMVFWRMTRYYFLEH